MGGLDGESLLPYLRSTGTALTAPSCSRTATRRIRTRRYVYIEHHPGGGGVRWYELYDLRHDPYRLTNLIGPGDTSTRPNLPGVGPDEVPELRARLDAGLDRLRDWGRSGVCLVLPIIYNQMVVGERMDALFG